MPEEKKFRTLDDPITSARLDPNCGLSMGPATVPGELLGLHSPRYKTRLIINCGYQILYEEPMPNRFWRFWQWVLLGWKWENL